MSDHTPVTDPVTPEPTADASASAATPAVHGSELWGGGRWIHNASEEPVWVETKAEYWALLNKMGFLMKDQQESTTGPEATAPASWVKPAPEIVAPTKPPDFTAEEADILYAYKAVMQQYGLIEKLACTACFQRGDNHGMRAFVGSKQIRFECRCGVAEYRPFAGTTDQAHFANTAKVMGDTVKSTILTASGQRQLPTEILTRDAARVFRKMARLYLARNWDPALFCAQCWERTPDEEHAIQFAVSHEQVVLTCRCRVLFYQGATL